MSDLALLRLDLLTHCTGMYCTLFVSAPLKVAGRLGLNS